MRVGIDVTPLVPPRTGVGNYTHFLLKHLLMQARGVSFHGLSSGMGRPEFPGPRDLNSHRHVGIPTRALYLLWSRLGRPRADRLLHGVDVFHATNYFLPPVDCARRVATFYDLTFLKHPEWCSPKIVGPFSAGVRRFAREADAIIVCSAATRNDAVELLGIEPRKVKVVYGAADAAFAPVPRPEAADFIAKHYEVRMPYLLFVSTLEPRKNVEGLLRAFARIALEIPHTLVLVGATGWNAGPIERALEELNLGSRVRRIGWVDSFSHLPAFYSAADLFVFPSFYEGFGLPVLEAMACGCPVVASDRASLPEVGGTAAQYVNPDDIDGMAEAIRALLADEPLRDAMSARGIERARAFSWDEAARQTLDIYWGLV